MIKRLLVVTLAVVGVVMVAATPAFASTVQLTKSDPKYDQVDTWSGGATPSLAQKKQADIVRVTYGRGVAHVWARFKFRDFNREAHLPGFGLTSDNDVDYKMYFVPGSRSGEYLTAPGGRGICSGKGSLRKDYTADTLQIGFPKSCFAKGHKWSPSRAHAYLYNKRYRLYLQDSVGNLPPFVPNP